MHHAVWTKRRLFTIGLFGLLLLILIALAGLPGETAAQPATPAPTPTATPTPEELAGVQDQRDWLEAALQYGIPGLLGLGILYLAARGVMAYFRGYEKTAENLGEKHSSAGIERITGIGQPDPKKQALTAYLLWLQDEWQYLPIIPIKSAERLAQLPLQDVYVPLRVVERTQIEGFRKLTLGEFDPGGEYRLREKALEDLERSQRVYRLLSDANRPAADDAEELREVTTTCLLLVGDAGSGKTTTLHFGTLVLAHDYQERATDGVAKLLDLHVARPLLPFYIRLTLVATYVREAYERADANALPGLHGAPAKLLLDWLDGYIQAQVGTKHPAMPADLPSQQIAAGNCLLLLDGLDETGDTGQRDYMQRLIINLVQDYPQNRYLVASRPFDDLRLPGFTERHLSPMNSEEMQTLLRNWFGAVYRTNAASPRAQTSVADQVSYLWGILERNPRLFEMATNPLLLTSMALLVQTGVGLPRERAELYNRLVYLLLETWRVSQVTGGVPGRSSGRPALYGGEESVASVQRRLQELAAWMQEQERREVRLNEAQNLLRPTYQQLMGWHDERADDYVCRLLESLALESGLLQKRDRGYSFAHYTLQEYLTARAYDQRSDGVAGLFAHYTQPRWRETILLAVGHWATSGDPERAQQLLRQLLDTGESDALLLTGAALDDADADRVPELAPLRAETSERLHTLAFDPTHCPDPRIRNQAGELLDRLDADNRTALDLKHPDYWAQKIKPGPFVMGEGQKRFTYRIKRSYALARFPVTNRQYLRFLEDLERQGRAEEAQQRRPRNWPGRRYPAGEGNHPVVTVNWRDASAFAQWANDTCLTEEQRAKGEAIRLPTEPEWERAAAYPFKLPEENPGAGRREFPWGDAGADFPANTRESGIGTTSVVGIFPQGAADCGAEELAGNVWEWCSTPYQKYSLPEDLQPETIYTTLDHQGRTSVRNRTYVLRGGSWLNDRSDARCAYRNFNDPTDGSVNYSFRLAHLFSL